MTDRIDTAILWTLLYADIFDFPMTAAEIHHFLIDTVATREQIDHALTNPSPRLAPHITHHPNGDTGWYALTPRADHVFASRERRLPPP